MNCYLTDSILSRGHWKPSQISKMIVVSRRRGSNLLHLEFTLIFILLAGGHFRLLLDCLVNGIEYVSEFARVKGEKAEVKSIWDLCCRWWDLTEFERHVTASMKKSPKRIRGCWKRKACFCQWNLPTPKILRGKGDWTWILAVFSNEIPFRLVYHDWGRTVVATTFIMDGCHTGDVFHLDIPIIVWSKNGLQQPSNRWKCLPNPILLESILVELTKSCQCSEGASYWEFGSFLRGTCAPWHQTWPSTSRLRAKEWDFGFQGAKNPDERVWIFRMVREERRENILLLRVG